MKTLTNIFYKLLIAICILIVLAIGFAIFIYIQFNTQNKKVGLIEVTYNEGATQIPFTFSNSGHIKVELSINNSKEKYPFILDSGAGNMFFKDLNEELTFKTIGRAISFDGFMRPFFGKIKRVPQIMVGDVEAKNVSFKEYKDFNLTCFNDTYGILGNTFMKHYTWLIDFENQIIHIAKDKEMLPPMPLQSYRVPLRKGTLGQHLYIDVKGIGEIHLDTGASGIYLMRNLKEKDSLLKKTSAKVLGNLTYGILGASKGKWSMVAMDSLQLGELTAKNIPAFLYQGNTSNILGLAFLKRYKVYLDWHNSEMWLSPIQEEANFDFETFGFGFFYNNRPEVGWVLENSKAYELGIRPGDKNIRIERHPTDLEQDFCSFKKQMQFLDTLTLSKENQKIVLTKKPLTARFLQ